MQDEHRERIRRMQVDFVKGLQHIEDVVDHLISDQVLTENQAQTILASGPTIADKTRSLLINLVRCGPNAYDAIVSALTETNQTHLVEKMSSLDITTKPQFSVVHSPKMKPAQAPQQPTVAPYPVNSTPRGYILLVNVANFTTGSGLSARNGSLEDVNSLQELFQELGYRVKVLLDPTAEILDESLTAFVQSPCHANVDAGGLIIMSHGLQDYIYTADGKMHAINDILNLFTNKSLPALAGKPKFILFQACRGEEKDRGSIYMPDAGRSRLDGLETPMKDATWTCLPYMSDCVIAYSTLPGFVSWRCEKKGSWFIQVLVNVFREHATRMHVLELLTEVNRRLVEESQDKEFKQITQPSNNLTRSFYLSTAHFRLGNWTPAPPLSFALFWPCMRADYHVAV